MNRLFLAVFFCPNSFGFCIDFEKAIATEEWIESFNDPVTEAFLEEFLEELGDAYVEAGYAIAKS
jgi:hypothetical protein